MAERDALMELKQEREERQRAEAAAALARTRSAEKRTQLAAAKAELEVLLAADGSPRTRAGCVDAVARHPLFRDRARPTFVAGDAPPRRGPARGGRVDACARAAARGGGWAPAWPALDAFFAADAEKPSEVADRLP